MITGSTLKASFDGNTLDHARDVKFKFKRLLMYKMRANVQGKGETQPDFSDFMLQFIKQNENQPWFSNQKKAFNETVRFMQANPEKLKDTNPFTKVHSKIVTNFFTQTNKEKGGLAK